MKKLTMTFLNEDGKKTNLRPKVADQNLSGETVKGVMDEITELDIFSKKGQKPYVEASSAKYTETITTELFK